MKNEAKNKQITADKTNDSKIIAGLLAFGSIELTAQQIGVPAGVIKLRLQDKEFRERINAEASETCIYAATEVCKWILPAINFTAAILTDSEATQETRLEAAKVILDYYKEFKDDII